jgi:hypothetical protein
MPSRPKISALGFGPFLTANGRAGEIACTEKFSDQYSSPVRLVHTGFSCEFVAGDAACNLGLFRKISRPKDKHVDFGDYYVSADHVPFAFNYLHHDLLETAQGDFVPLGSVLKGLYKSFPEARPVTEFLVEARQSLVLRDERPHRSHKDSLKWVNPELAEAGFGAVWFFDYGRTMTVGFAWIAPEDRADPKGKPNFFAGSVEFRPRPDRTLNEGRWCPPGDSGIMEVLGAVLRKLHRGPGVKMFSEAGIRHALDEFSWRRLTTLTTKEATAARIQFVREHPELHDNLPDLARALRKAELYCESTATGTIVKMLPQFLAAAKQAPE